MRENKGTDAMRAVLEIANLIAESKFEHKIFRPDPAADTVLRNAERLLADAAILAQHGSYQSALSLAALSFEESGKSCIVRWQKAGLLNRDIGKEIKAGHWCKQRVFLAYIGAKAMGDFVKYHKDDQSAIASFMALGESAFISMHDADTLKSLLVEIVFLLGEFDNILRFSGFYQDLDKELNAKDQSLSGSGTEFRVFYEQMRDRASKSLGMGRADPATQFVTASLYEYWRMQLLDRKDREEKLKMLYEAMEGARISDANSTR